MNGHPPDPPTSERCSWRTLLERAWHEREDVAYPALFGALEPTIAPLDAALFCDMFGQSTIDPRWLHIGVMIAPPTATRTSWLYVSSGLSNPWDANSPAIASGLGREFIIEAPTRADWPIVRLQHVIAFELLLDAGRYAAHQPLGRFDRLPLRGPITSEHDSRLQYLFVTPGFRSKHIIQLESGQVELLTLVGITAEEAEFAREHGGELLLATLRRFGASPVTDPSRQSVVLPSRA